MSDSLREPQRAKIDFGRRIESWNFAALPVSRHEVYVDKPKLRSEMVEPAYVFTNAFSTFTFGLLLMFARAPCVFQCMEISCTCRCRAKGVYRERWHQHHAIEVNGYIS